LAAAGRSLPTLCSTNIRAVSSHALISIEWHMLHYLDIKTYSTLTCTTEQQDRK
jgi:hypothetical protein